MQFECPDCCTFDHDHFLWTRKWKKNIIFLAVFNWSRTIENVKYTIGSRQHPKYYVVACLIINKRNEVYNMFGCLACGTCKTWQSAREWQRTRTRAMPSATLWCTRSTVTVSWWWPTLCRTCSSHGGLSLESPSPRRCPT